MKSSRVIYPLLILLSVALSGSAPAADLQAGRYANVSSVSLYQYDSQGYPFIRAGLWFTTSPGMYGPFLVGDGPYHTRDWRDISVPSTVTGVGPDSSLVLPVGTGMTLGEPIAWISIPWVADYDATQMQLEFWRTRSNGIAERLWAQQLSGYRYGSVDVAQNTFLEGPLYFKVSVIPEPASFNLLVGGLSALLLTIRRRRTK